MFNPDIEIQFSGYSLWEILFPHNLEISYVEKFPFGWFGIIMEVYIVGCTPVWLPFPNNVLRKLNFVFLVVIWKLEIVNNYLRKSCFIGIDNFRLSAWLFPYNQTSLKFKSWSVQAVSCGVCLRLHGGLCVRS